MTQAADVPPKRPKTPRKMEPEKRPATHVVIELSLPSPASANSVASCVMTIDRAVQETLVQFFTILRTSQPEAGRSEELVELARTIRRATGRCCEIAAVTPGSILFNIQVDIAPIIVAVTTLLVAFGRTKTGKALDDIASRWIKTALPGHLIQLFKKKRGVRPIIHIDEDPTGPDAPLQRIRVAVGPEEEDLQVDELRVPEHRRKRR